MLIITRQASDFEETSKNLQFSNVINYSLPLYSTKFLSNLPKKNYDYFITTSKNAESFIKANNLKPNKKIINLESFANVNSLFNYLQNQPDILSNCIYLRGKDITLDLATNLSIPELIVYEANYVDNFTDSQIEALKCASAITIFSVKAAEKFCNILGQTQINADLFVLSNKIADIVTTYGFKNIYIADEPNILSMKRKIQEVKKWQNLG